MTTFGSHRHTSSQVLAEVATALLMCSCGSFSQMVCRATFNSCKKTTFIKTVIGDVSCTSKTAKIHRFVRFLMHCSITTLPVAFYWACSDDTVHHKSDKTVNFCGFKCTTTSPITVFINVVFYIYICCMICAILVNRHIHTHTHKKDSFWPIILLAQPAELITKASTLIQQYLHTSVQLSSGEDIKGPKPHLNQHLKAVFISCMLLQSVPKK